MARVHIIKNKNIEGLTYYLKFIPNKYFKNRKEYYEYIGDKLKLDIKINLKKNRKKFEQATKVKVIIQLI